MNAPQTRIETRFLALYQSLVYHPIKWLSAWLMVLATLFSILWVTTQGLNNITYYNGPYLYFTKDNPDYLALREMEQTYASDTSLIFLVSARQGDLFSRSSLKALAELTESAWTLPYVLRVDSIANFQHTTVADQLLETDYLYENAATLSREDLSAIKTIALQEPSLLRQSLSEDGTIATVVARINIDEAQTQALELVPKAQALANSLVKRYPQLNIQLLGDAPNAAATEQATQETFRFITPISMLLVLLCLFFILRNAFSVLVCQIIISLSIMLGYCLFILMDCKLSPISAGASPIILTLAVADSIHLLVTYQFQSAQGKNKQQAMLESLRVNFSPVWLTSITTAIGFLCMNFAESPPFHDLGNAVFLGVLMAFLLSTTMLPPLMMLLPQPKSTAINNKRKLISTLAFFTIQHRKALLVSMSVVMLGLTACIPLNRINDFLLEYFDETYPVRQALDSYLDNMGGLQRLQYAIPAKGPGGINDPNYLQQVDNLVNWVERDPRVSHVRSFTHVVKRLNRDMHEGNQSHYRIPTDATLISQYILMYELGLPFGLGLDTQVDIQKSQTKLEIVFNRLPSEELVAARQDINQWIKTNWPDYMQTKATGLDSLFSDITFANVRSMIAGTVLALATVSLLLIFTLGSIRYGLLSLIPNLLPAAMTFGAWGLIDGEMGIVVSIISCMTLGIIVDDTVHFLSKYVRAKRELGLDHNGAAQYAFETVGVALIATSVILIANFSVMALSHYYPNAATGILTSITIGFALLIDFFFFVPLLLWLDGKRANQPKQQLAEAIP